MQEMKVLFLTSYEVSMSVVFSMVTVYLSIKFLNKFILSSPVEVFIRKRHVPGCLISGILICCVLFLVQGSIEHSTLALQSLVIAHNAFTLKILGIALLYFLAFYVVTFITSFFVIFVISIMYRRMMKDIDFDDEVDNHQNLGLSVFLSVTLIGIIVFIEKPLNHLLGSMVFHEWLEKL